MTHLTYRPPENAFRTFHTPEAVKAYQNGYHNDPLPSTNDQNLLHAYWTGFFDREWADRQKERTQV